MSKIPAIIGGPAAFPTFFPIIRPTLPSVSAFDGKIEEIVLTGMLTKGRHVQEFEQQVARHLGVKNAVAVSSCTLGLVLTYKGMGLTGEVIVPSFTFMATVHPLVWVGATPVFVDIDRNNWNIDPSQTEAAITSSTSAIVAVHNFGNPARVDELQQIARRNGIRLIFDAAHGFGSVYRGKAVGSFGDAEVFSLSPTKLVVAGEGGIVATNHDDLAQFIRTGREYGNSGDYGSEFAGLNARMPEFNALLGSKSLDMLDQNVKSRNRIATLYREGLRHIPGLWFQEVEPGDRSSYKDLSIVIDEDAFELSRDELAKGLLAENIDTRKYHDPPVHTHMTYREVVKRGPLGNTEWVASRSLSLPIYSHMADDMVWRVCRALETIWTYREQVRHSFKSASAHRNSVGA